MKELKFRAWAIKEINPVFADCWKQKEEKFGTHFDNYKGDTVFYEFDDWYEAQKEYFDEILPKNYNDFVEYSNEIIYDKFDLTADGRKQARHGYKLLEVMQYIGLKDKNGKMIYEGDIVKDIRNNKFAEVKMNKFGQWALFWKDWDRMNNYNGELFNSWIFDENILEIIGNIYENKDLFDK